MAIFKKYKPEEKKEEAKTTEMKEPKAVSHFKTHAKNVLVKPWVTEKSTDLGKENAYVFLVTSDATKPLIRENIAKRYNVMPVNVRIVVKKGKVKYFRNQPKRRSGIKKAVITLKKGDKIEIQ